MKNAQLINATALQAPCSTAELRTLTDHGAYVPLSCAEVGAVTRAGLGEAINLWLWLRASAFTPSGQVERRWSDISKAMCIPESTLRRWAMKLEASGYVRVTRRKASSDMNLPNLFEAVLPGAVAAQLLAELKPRRKNPAPTKEENPKTTQPVKTHKTETKEPDRTPGKEAQPQVYTVFTCGQLEEIARREGLDENKAAEYGRARGQLREGCLSIVGHKVLLEFFASDALKKALLEASGATSIRFVQQLEGVPAAAGKVPGKGVVNRKGGTAVPSFRMEIGVPNNHRSVLQAVRAHLDLLPTWSISRSKDRVAKEVLWSCRHMKSLSGLSLEHGIRSCLKLVVDGRFETPYELRAGKDKADAFFQYLESFC